MTKILIIEDEAHIAEILKYLLEKEGYEADISVDGESGIKASLNTHYDLVLLDLMLPGIDGFEVLKKIRAVKSMPIIILTAKDAEVDKVLGLELGADDYVIKPFSNRELLARIKAHLRRSLGTVQGRGEEITIGDLKILTNSYQVFKKGEEIDLTYREYELLLHLIRNKGTVLTREHLLQAVWGFDYFGDVRTVDVTIRRLREKIEDDPSNPVYIHTRRGVGYTFREGRG
ncbi:winged helix-turn-helix domain-containing protein [Thermicanus aegyptius]|uniref:winged helix-turn-helix domain-containing protein n=1 Tax=Thermicanus aegyptius TaxID=94009 RepID=UPI00048CCC1D|nr:winged helix-turn-helix domain-containing protein [Thermicanus aegyptius]MBE3554545.1 response regulator transcription factor [Thermicanus sp.]